MRNKVILGTANFGLRYGIANNTKLAPEEVSAILEYAHARGVWGIDTARAYGDAEERIGEYFSEHGKVFTVIGKLPGKEYLSAHDVEEEVFASLKSMNISSIDFLLLHSHETYRLYGKTVLPVLRALSRDGIIGRYGVSVYHREEAADFLKDAGGPVAIELPLNLFDQRFLQENCIAEIKGQGHTVFARSVFLQGLFFLNDGRLNGNFSKVKEKVGRIREISGTYHMRPECLALLFALANPHIDGVVTGIDSTEQLACNIECLSEGNLDKYKSLEYLLAELAVYDENIVLPYRWNA